MEMEYNSARSELIIPEYGRHVQKLVQHAKTIEEPAYRQAFVEAIVDLMMQMHPQSRNMDDYREKLWKHIFRIADFELDVVGPNGERPSREEAEKKPDMIPYPHSEAKFRHYGDNVQRLIQKAMEMEDGPKKAGFVEVIASYMKLAYKTWNKEYYVSDDIIKSDLSALSEGQLNLADEMSIENLGANRRRNTKQRPSSGGNNGGGNGKGHRGKGGGRKRKS